jgi:hypothetical protein
MNSAEHVQHVNVRHCSRLPGCDGSEKGCNGTECLDLRWQKWTHEQYLDIFGHCPHGCKQKQSSGPKPPPGNFTPRGVRTQPKVADNSLHLCHARGCGNPVPPRLLMCLRHWRMVPIDIQRRVWKHFRPGQENDKRPSPEYIEVMKEAIEVVAKKEGL